MHASFASLILAALVVSPAIAAPLTPIGQDGSHVILPRNANINKDGPHFILPRNANINQDGPHFILPRQGGPVQGLQSSQPLQSASGQAPASSSRPSIELPVMFQPIGPVVPVSNKREAARPVSFIPVGAALDGTNSAPATTASTGAEAAAAPASSSTGTPVGTRPVSFIPVGAALGGNAKREPVQSPPIIAPGRLPSGSATTGSAPTTTQSTSTGVRPVSFIPVNSLEGADSTTAKRASTIHSVSFIPEGALNGNEKRIIDAVNPFPVNSPIDYAGAQKREPVRGPVSFIPVSALTGAQRQARRQEAAIPPAGSAPGTVPASVTYSVGESDGPMLYVFQNDGSVVAMPVPSGTV